MRIAVFIKATTFHKGYGGMETQNKILCEGLAARGHVVTVFSPQKSFGELTAQANGVNYIFVSAVYKTMYPQFLKDNWYTKSAEVFRLEHAKNKFDVVLSQSSAGLGIIKRKEEFSVKVVAIAHGSIISELSTRFKNSYTLKSCVKLIPDTVFALYNFFSRQRAFILGSDKIVAVSNYVKNALVNETYAPEAKFIVIHNGVDPDAFGQAKVGDAADAQAQVRILYVGQLIKEKGVMLLPEIAKDTRFSTCVLHVVGGGDAETELQAEIQRARLQDKLILHGKKPYDETLRFYQESELFLFPTKRIEGFPMVLVEAMLAGLPVVGFDLGGVSDAVFNNETGFLVKDGDVAGFKDALFKLVSDKHLRQSFGKNARIKAETEFTSKLMLANYEKVLLENTL